MTKELRDYLIKTYGLKDDVKDLLKQMFGIDINATIFDDENTDRFEDIVNQIEQTGEDYAKDILTRSRNEDNRVYTD